ncbi:HNH endonuclease [Salmonella enterica subsp. enterica serovar Newport]|nr:HNH endonuclease [Salmonella enterica subsp. enterica serovar Newport]
MNYTKIYDTVVANALQREPFEGMEVHHILPRCMGGDDRDSNLVKLTRKEHFVCHRLLAKTGGKAALSFTMMKNRSNSKTSREYSLRRESVVSSHREYRHSDETRKKMSGWKHTDEAKRNISDKCNNKGKSPWEVTNANTEMWKLAGDVYDSWLKGNGYVKLMREFPLLSQMTSQTMTRKFKSGWIPRKDQSWVEWLSDAE